MKCKSCGNELNTGIKSCPRCGATVDTSNIRSEKAFDWSGFSPQSRKKKDVSIDWNNGKIFDKTSGKVYSQKSHTWSEPEDVKDLFSFDRKNEVYQEVLDRQIEGISKESAADIHQQSGGRFELPSSMDILKLDSFIKGNYIQLVSETGEPLQINNSDTRAAVNQTPAEEQAVKDKDIPQHAFDRKEKGIPESETGQVAADTVIETHDDKSKDRSDTYTSEEEDRVSNSLKKLIAAEEKFKTDMERASFLTPEESMQVEILEEKRNKLIFASKDSYRSIEDEYEAYCDENGIKRKKSDAHESLPADSGSGPIRKRHSLKDSIMNTFKNPEMNQDKAVEIKINEPSGTKVTVKTQEVSLAAIEKELGDTQTREVDMKGIINQPKNLQVSVEVNAAQGNASVEVTRRHDGATVVKTVDKGGNDSFYIDNKESEGQADNDGEDGSSGESSENPSRMTITDIFGPEARDILNQISIEHDDEKNENDTNLENSLILDIAPEDIAITEDQTAALHTISAELFEEDMEDDADEDMENDADEDKGSGDLESDESEKEEITENSEPAEEHDIEEAYTGGTQADEEPESEPEHSEAEEIKEPAVMSGESNPSDETDADEKTSAETSQLEKTKPIMKAEKAIQKEAERQKKRAEKAQKKLLKENNKPDTQESKGMGKALKAFTAILVIILVVEFSIIGIKLFAPNSQAAVFVTKVEQYAADIYKGIAGSGEQSRSQQESDTSEQSADQSQQSEQSNQSSDSDGTAAQETKQG